MKDKRLISIIIPTYNRCESLKDTLDSVLKQDCNKEFDYELIIVDNNSKDKTRAVVEGYKDRFDGRLRYLIEEKKGRSYALNTGIKESKGEIVAFTDDDCILARNLLSEVHNVFKKREDLLFVCGKILLYRDEKIKIPRWCDDSILNSVFGAVSFGDKEKYLSINNRGPGGINMFLKKELFNKIGYFNTTFARGQDTEFYFRAYKKGIKMYYSPNIITFHKIVTMRLTKKYFKYYFYISGKALARSKDTIINSRRKVWNIPLWVIKGAIIELIKSLFCLLKMDPKGSFRHQVEFSYLVGIIRGRRDYV